MLNTHTFSAASEASTPIVPLFKDPEGSSSDLELNSRTNFDEDSGNTGDSGNTDGSGRTTSAQAFTFGAFASSPSDEQRGPAWISPFADTSGSSSPVSASASSAVAPMETDAIPPIDFAQSQSSPLPVTQKLHAVPAISTAAHASLQAPLARSHTAVAASSLSSEEIALVSAEISSSAITAPPTAVSGPSHSNSAVAPASGAIPAHSNQAAGSELAVLELEVDAEPDEASDGEATGGLWQHF